MRSHWKPHPKPISSVLVLPMDWRDSIPKSCARLKSKWGYFLPHKTKEQGWVLPVRTELSFLLIFSTDTQISISAKGEFQTRLLLLHYAINPAVRTHSYSERKRVNIVGSAPAVRPSGLPTWSSKTNKGCSGVVAKDRENEFRFLALSSEQHRSTSGLGRALKVATIPTTASHYISPVASPPGSPPLSFSFSYVGVRKVEVGLWAENMNSITKKQPTKKRQMRGGMVLLYEVSGVPPEKRENREFPQNIYD